MKVPRILRKSPIYQFLRKTSLGRKYLIKTGKLVSREELIQVHAEGVPLKLESSVKDKPVVGIVYPEEMIPGYVIPKASAYMYERFCKTNGIEYRNYDIHASDWLDKAKELDVIFWHVDSTPSALYEAESKIYILDKILQKTCFPSFHEVWQYEDKCRAHYLYQVYNLPCIPTRSSNSREESIKLSETINYPIIVKTRTGAGSFGVKKIDNKTKLRRYIKSVFSSRGKYTLYPYERQKDYILLQEFIDNASYDLRVMLVGNKAYGYYRYPNKGDFRASGEGNEDHSRPTPISVLKEAIKVREALESRVLGVDFLYSDKYKQHLIIEASIFNEIDPPSIETRLEGVPGFYNISDPENICYEEGAFWFPELIAESIIKQWIIENT
ncbi:RimK-like ATP-grasp domain protein [Bacteroidales bacterium KA00251]|nr:RimK-like ATP-grasp domain protein [Bacteroidales bacterium KA00251]